MSSLSQIRPDINWTDLQQVDINELRQSPLAVFKKFVKASMSPTHSSDSVKNNPTLQLVEFNSPAFWMTDDPTWQGITLTPTIVQ